MEKIYMYNLTMEVWGNSKVEDMNVRGITRYTFAQDLWNSHTDYIEKDEDGSAEDGKEPMEDIDFVTWMDEAIDSGTLLQVSDNDQCNHHTDFMQGAMKKDKRQPQNHTHHLY